MLSGAEPESVSVESLLGARDGPGYVTDCSPFSPYFCLHSIGLTSQVTSDFQLMKAVSEKTRLSPLGRQQHLARLADDIQRYGGASLGPACTHLRPGLYTWVTCEMFRSLMKMSHS